MLLHRRYVVVPAVILMQFYALALARADDGPAFKPLSVVSSTGISYEVLVDDKKYAVVTYSGLDVAVTAGNDDPATPESVTRVASLVLPLGGAQGGVKIGISAEGYASLDDHADASLIVTANGQPHVLDFLGLKSEGDPLVSGPCEATMRTHSTPAPRSVERSSKEKQVIDASFMQCFILELASATDLRMNFVLNLSRRDREGDGNVNISTVHINILGAQ